MLLIEQVLYGEICKHVRKQARSGEEIEHEYGIALTSAWLYEQLWSLIDVTEFPELQFEGTKLCSTPHIIQSLVMVYLDL
jgi:hypothetical protein